MIKGRVKQGLFSEEEKNKLGGVRKTFEREDLWGGVDRLGLTICFQMPN